MTHDLRSFAGLALTILLAAGLAWAGSQHGSHYQGMPVFALCGVLAFGINWLAFVPAYHWQTERFYDLTGSATFLTLVLVAVSLVGTPHPRSAILVALVALWALRLGPFLFVRVIRDGGDGRHPLREDAEHDGREETGGGEAEGEGHDLADEARRVDAQNACHHHGEADHHQSCLAHQI